MLIMMIIIDDLHDYFNLDNYHDCWLIGDHMMMNMVRDYETNVTSAPLAKFTRPIGKMYLIFYPHLGRRNPDHCVILPANADDLN